MVYCDPEITRPTHIPPTPQMVVQDKKEEVDAKTARVIKGLKPLIRIDFRRPQGTLRTDEPTPSMKTWVRGNGLWNLYSSTSIHQPTEGLTSEMTTWPDPMSRPVATIEECDTSNPMGFSKI